jgi:hypothetical protein
VIVMIMRRLKEISFSAASKGFKFNLWNNHW